MISKYNCDHRCQIEDPLKLQLDAACGVGVWLSIISCKIYLHIKQPYLFVYSQYQTVRKPQLNK